MLLEFIILASSSSNVEARVGQGFGELPSSQVTLRGYTAVHPQVRHTFTNIKTESLYFKPVLHTSEVQENVNTEQQHHQQQQGTKYFTYVWTDSSIAEKVPRQDLHDEDAHVWSYMKISRTCALSVACTAVMTPTTSRANDSCKT